MAFDACFMTAISSELDCELAGAKVEKIYQPSRDTVILSLKERQESGGRAVRLCLDCGAASPRICLSSFSPENPASPPMFCMLLRKHLSGARIGSVRQLGFDRACEVEFDTRDEMGFETKRYLIIEIMAKCSNIIFCGEEHKIIASVKTVDFSTSMKRQILPGMKYELPPAQEGKISPFDESEEGFSEKLGKTDLPADRFIMTNYSGISPLVAREIALRGEKTGLWSAFSGVLDEIRGGKALPSLVLDESGLPLDYSFTKIAQYGTKNEIKESFSALIDGFYAKKAEAERMRQRSSDILRLLTNAETRIKKKIAIQTSDLEACREKEKYKQKGDLITSNIYRLKQGDRSVKVVNYYSEELEEVDIELDPRLSPSDNAQKYYKKYAKSKSAEVALAKQLDLAKKELDYVDTVFESLTKAETEADLAEIRRELYSSGYASKMKNPAETKKIASSKPMEFLTSGGYRVLCGKNNVQNDQLTLHTASKGDLWFHVKGMPGSHVILFCDGEEPPAEDFTEAATIAAFYSKAKTGQKVEVDYTRVKNIKKPSGANPGFVTYQTNYSAVVTPSEKLVSSLRKS